MYNLAKKYLLLGLSLFLLIVATIFFFDQKKTTVAQTEVETKKITKPVHIKYEGAVAIKELENIDDIMAELEAIQTAGTFNLVAMAQGITEEALKAFSDTNEHSLPLLSHWNVGIPEFADTMNPMYMISRIEEGEHILVSWKLDPYYADTIGSSYYEESIKKAAELQLPLVFILPAPESALTKDNYYKGLPNEENPNVVDKDGNVLDKLSPFGPDNKWKEVGGLWSKTALMSQIQEWYPNPPLVIFISEDEADKLSWSELTSSSRFSQQYPTDKDDNFNRILVGAKWIEKYRQLQNGFKEGFTESVWKDNVKFISYNKLSDNLGTSTDWIDSATVTNQYINLWPLTTNGTTIDFDLTGTKNDTTVDSPHVLANNLPFMLKEAKSKNPSFAYQLSINDDSKITDVTRYRGLTQFALWFLRPNFIRQKSSATTRTELEPMFEELVDSVNLIHYNPEIAEFWKSGELVSNGSSPLNNNIPEQYKDDPRWFLLDTGENLQKVWAFTIVKGIAPNREWLIYTQSPENDMSNITVTVPNFGNVLVNSTQEGGFYTLTESNAGVVAIADENIITSVSNIKVTNITDHSCDVTWEGNPNAKTWLYVYPTDTTGSEHDATNNTYTYPILGSDMQFKVFVQGVGDDTIHEATFTTLSEAEPTSTTDPIYTPTYYVDAINGLDSNNGTSSSTAWKTMDKVTSSTLASGDVIAFNRGQTFSGNMAISESGTSGNPIILTAYGSGARPILGDKRLLTGTWTSIGSNRWTINSVCGVGRMWRNDIEIGKVGYVGGINDLNEFTNTSAIYGYVNGTTTLYSITDPNLDTFYYLGNYNIIGLTGDYIKISGLDVRYGASSTISVSGAYNTIEYSTVGIDAGTGILSKNSSNLLVERNTIDNNFFLSFEGVAEYRVANGLSMTGSDARGSNDGLVSFSGMNNAVIRYNTFKNWGHAGFAMTSFSLSDGCTGNYIHHNIFDGNGLHYARGIGYSGDHVTLNEISYNYITNMSVRSQLNGTNNHIHHNFMDNFTNTPYKIGEQGQAIGIENYNGNPTGNLYEYNTISNTDGPAIELIASGSSSKDISGNIFNKNSFINCGRNPYYSRAIGKGLYVQGYVDVRHNTFTDNSATSGLTTSTVYHRTAEVTPLSFTDRTDAIFNYGDGDVSDTISGNTSTVTDQGANLDITTVGVAAK